MKTLCKRVYRSRVKHRSLAQQRGAAMVEAIATLPVFIILFIGVFYVRDGLVETQKLDTKARSCAWLYSKSACRKMPSGCDDIVRSGNLELKKSSFQEQVESAAGEVQNAGQGSSADGIIQKLAGKFIGPAVSDLFSKAALADTEGTIERPVLFGGGTLVVKSHYQLACDLEESDPLDVAKEAWKKARDKNK